MLLDLKRDSYTYVAPEHAADVLPMLSGTTGHDMVKIVQDEHRSGSGQSTVDELKRAGLVTTKESGKVFRPITHSSVVEELPRLIGADRPKVHPGHVWNFFRSVLLAKFMLSFLPLHWVVGFVEKRRRRRTKPVTVYSAAELTEIYRRLRPLLFSRSDRCLLDSLSLINFLRRYHVQAFWRFGVRLEPFKAHAWVQDDGTVFDDMAANIHRFTVILEA